MASPPSQPTPEQKGNPSPGDTGNPWDSWVDGPANVPTPAPTGMPPIAQVVQPNLVLASIAETGPLILVETAFLASTTGLLWLINFYFPLGPLWRICFPIPIALAYLRWNLRAAWMTAIVATLLLSVLMGPVRSLFFLMPFGFMGVILGWCWRRKLGWLTSIGLGTIVATLGFFFRVWLTSLLLGEDLWIYVTTQVTRFLDWLAILFGLMIQPELAIVQACALGLVVLNSVIYLFVVHLLANYLLDRLGSAIPAPPKWVQAFLEIEP